MKKLFSIIREYMGAILFISVCIIMFNMYVDRIAELRQIEEQNNISSVYVEGK